jgi:hypothetical protein
VSLETDLVAIVSMKMYINKFGVRGIMPIRIISIIEGENYIEEKGIDEDGNVITRISDRTRNNILIIREEA